MSLSGQTPNALRSCSFSLFNSVQRGEADPPAAGRADGCASLLNLRLSIYR